MIIKKFRSYLKNKIYPYFASVRWAVLLIVIPAIFIGSYNFFDIFSEVIIEKRRSLGAEYENRLAPLKKDLPAHAYVNYVTDQTIGPDYVRVRYALIPARIINGRKPAHDYLVAQYLNGSKIPKFEGYTLKKNYGNGAMLFKRNR